MRRHIAISQGLESCATSTLREAMPSNIGYAGRRAKESVWHKTTALHP
jgi:hypothetical protein